MTLLLFSVTSCIKPTGDWRSPDSQPMTKWVAEGIELYMLDPISDSFMIVNYGGTKMFFEVTFDWPSFYNDERWTMIIWDREYSNTHTSADCLDSRGETCDLGRRIYSSLFEGDVELISRTKCRVTMRHCEISGGGYDVPELMFPKELVFTRVAKNLTNEDIPTMERSEQYADCPIYRGLSHWISDDSKMILWIGRRRYKCQLVGEQEIELHANFFESNSSVFLTKITEETAWI